MSNAPSATVPELGPSPEVVLGPADAAAAVTVALLMDSREARGCRFPPTALPAGAAAATAITTAVFELAGAAVVAASPAGGV